MSAVNAWGQDFGVISKSEAGRSGDSASVYLTLNPEMLTLAPTEVLSIMPKLKAKGDSMELPAIHVLGRSTYYRYLRHDNLGLILPEDRVLWEKRRWRPFAYLEKTKWETWMDNAVLEVQIQLTDCNEAYLSAMTKELPRSSSQRDDNRPTATVAQVRHGVITDRVTVIFPLDRTEIHPELYDNRRELDKIRKSIETVENDRNAELRQLTIKGYASPEGPYWNNVRLARGRTDSIGVYVSRFFHLDKDKIHTENEPEDWEGLIDYISKATLEQLPHRDQLLEIARRPLPPDKRERLMRTRYPEDFDHLLKYCLPFLRHTDYRIDYDRKEVVMMPSTEQMAAKKADTPPPLPQREGIYQPLRPYKALFALKTNLLFDAALAFNGELEVPIGRNNRWSIMGEYWTPWYVWHNNSRSYELQVFGLEGRYWLGQCRERKPWLTGWFVGAYYAYGRYDFEWKSVGDQGELHSVGISAGYSWPIHRHWNLELSASLGGFHGPRRHYNGEYDDTHLIWKYTSSTTYFGPTKLKVSLVWLIGRNRDDAGKEDRR